MEEFETEAGKRLYEKIRSDEPYALRDQAYEDGLTREDLQYILDVEQAMGHFAELLGTSLEAERISDAYGGIVDPEDAGLGMTVDKWDAAVGHDWAVYTKEVLRQLRDPPLEPAQSEAFGLDRKVEPQNVMKALLDEDNNPDFDREDLLGVAEEFAQFVNQNTTSEQPHYHKETYRLLNA